MRHTWVAKRGTRPGRGGVVCLGGRQ